MALAIAALKEIFRTSVKIEMLILSVVLYVAMWVIIFFLIILMLLILLPMIFIGGPLAFFFAFFIAFSIFLLFSIAIGAIQSGMLIKASMHALQNKKFKIMKVFNDVKPKVFTLVGLTLVLVIFYLLILFILLIPAIIVGLNYLQNPPFSTLELVQFVPSIQQENFTPILLFFVEKFLDLILLIVGAFIAFQIIALLISPFTILIVPMVIFENKGAIEAIKNGIKVGKKNYFFNLKVLFVYMVFATSVGLLIFMPVLIGIPSDALSIVFSLYFSILISVIAAKLYLTNKGKVVTPTNKNK